jgi:hypothetical protein
MATALGIRPHCGWAVVVAVSGPPRPELRHRSRLELLPETLPRQPWHHAQDARLAPDDAAALATEVEDAARVAAEKAIAEIVASLGDVAVAAVIGEPHELPPAAKVLTNHSLLHAAEGELFWSAMADGCGAAGVPVVAAHPRSVDLGAHTGLLTAMGKSAGPPWQADHKLAVAAALRALDER